MSLRLEALIPGAQGRLLAALLRAGDPVSIRRFASLARVSPNRTSELVDYLLRLGLVDRRDVVRSALVGLVQDSPVVEALRRVEDLREETLTRWRYLARDLPHQVTALGVYGSWARGESTLDSDLDLVAVLSAGLGGEVEDRTREQLGLVVQAAGRVAGMTPSLVVIEFGELLSSTAELWRSVRRDAVTIHGQDLRRLLGAA